MANAVVNLNDNLSMFSEYWKPKFVSIFKEFEIMMIKSKKRGGRFKLEFP
jgi:hypothetical protein